jgi:Aegerolysin
VASRSITVVLKNATSDVTLVLSNHSLSHGDWDVAPYFTALPPKSITAWTSQSDGVATGTQGVVQLTFQSDPSRIVTLNWDNPFATSNVYSGTAPWPYSVSYHGGFGYNAIVTFIFTK